MIDVLRFAWWSTRRRVHYSSRILVVIATFFMVGSCLANGWWPLWVGCVMYAIGHLNGEYALQTASAAARQRMLNDKWRNDYGEG